jgi:hypothetical protein
MRTSKYLTVYFIVYYTLKLYKTNDVLSSVFLREIPRIRFFAGNKGRNAAKRGERMDARFSQGDAFPKEPFGLARGHDRLRTTIVIL